MYIQIFNNLHNDIIAGKYQAGQQLPSEQDIIKQYNVSRITATAALKKLVTEGLAYRLRGKGTFVSRPRIRGVSSLGSFSKEIRLRGLVPSSRLISVELSAFDEEIKQKLEISSNEQCYKIMRIRYANDEPVAFETAYLPFNFFPHIDQEDLENKSLYEIMEKKFGFIPSSVDSIFEAVVIDSDSEKYLELEHGSPVLSIWRITRDANLIPLEWVHTLYRGDRFSLYIENVSIPIER